jgi:CubicO group peptidase (beta-lactamase class C family)
MTAATYDPRSVPADRRSTCYLRVPDTDWLRPDERIWEPMWTAAGGLSSTARDLARFSSFLIGDGSPTPPLGLASLEEMCAPQIVVDQTWTQAHGLGPMMIRAGDRVLVGHAGGVFSVAGWLLVSRRDRVGVVCLTNVGDEAPLLPIACDLIGIAAADAAPAAPRPANPVSPKYASLLGRYVGDRGLVLMVTWTGDRLTVEWPATPGLPPPPRAEVMSDADGTLRFVDGPYVGEEMIVEREAGGRVRGWEACTYWYARL